MGLRMPEKGILLNDWSPSRGRRGIGPPRIIWKSFLGFFIVLLLSSFACVVRSDDWGGCFSPNAEHPALTSPTRQVVICGGKYDWQSMESACAMGWHVCDRGEFLANYPSYCKDQSDVSSFGELQETRCNTCTNPTYKGGVPNVEAELCGNFNSTALPASGTPFGSIALISGGDILVAEDEIFPGLDSWSVLHEDDYIDSLLAAFCCSNTFLYSTMSTPCACHICEAEHPMFTNEARTAALCGGTYSIEALRGSEQSPCSNDFHVCDYFEWESAYADSLLQKPPVCPCGALTTFGTLQDERSRACPDENGWQLFQPIAEEFHCGNLCHVPWVPHGVAILTDDHDRILFQPGNTILEDWIGPKHFSLREPEFSGQFSVMCCQDGVSRTGNVRCPSQDTYSLKSLYIAVGCIVALFLTLAVGVFVAPFILTPMTNAILSLAKPNHPVEYQIVDAQGDSPATDTAETQDIPDYETEVIEIVEP